MSNIEEYLRIVDYDFSDEVLSEKIVVKFKINNNNNITPYDFLAIFKDQKGERFVIKSPEKKEFIVGIGHEVTWGYDSSDFLKNYDNTSILEDFQSLSSQVTEIEIDELSEEYFGIYGGISDGENKKSQEWIDFSDTMFVIPSILAVFKNNTIEFTLFFSIKKDNNFISSWKERVEFLLELNNIKSIEYKEPKIKVVREIYPEIWQENIRKALKEIEQENFSRISLSRKTQILLENELSLTAVVKYFLNKQLSFICFESKKSIFITSNPLLTLITKENQISAYVYFQKENLFSGFKSINFKNDNFEKDYKDRLERYTGYEFSVNKDKTLVGKNLDIYAVFNTTGKNPIKDNKILSLLYPVNIIKGFPYDLTSRFLQENENIGYGYWYGPFGFINKNLEANFYTCGNTIVSFSNVLTIFTTILVDSGLNYDEIIKNSDILVNKNLKLFKVADKED